MQSVTITNLPANGQLSLAGVPVAVNQEIPVADLGNLTYQGNFGFAATDSFTWGAADDLAIPPRTPH